MPLTYNFECNLSSYREDKNKFNVFLPPECDFKVKDYDGPHMFININGVEKGLSHPQEENIALALTGKTISQLIDENKIIFKIDKICLNCFNYEKLCKCNNPNLIEIPKLEGMQCPKCKKGKIIKYQGGIS